MFNTLAFIVNPCLKPPYTKFTCQKKLYAIYVRIKESVRKKFKLTDVGYQKKTNELNLKKMAN